MKSLLLTGLLFAAVVQSASAQTNPQVFSEVPVDVMVSGVGFDQYGIQLTVTRGSFACGGQQWIFQYQYTVRHIATQNGAAGQRTFFKQLQIPICNGKTYCAIAHPEVRPGSASGGNPNNWIVNNGLAGGQTSVNWQVDPNAAGGPVANGMPDGGIWRFTFYTNVLPDISNRSLSMNESHCITFAPLDCPEGAGTMQYVFPCGALEIPGGCAPKQFNIAQVYPATRVELSGYPGPGCWNGGTVTNFENLSPPIRPTVPGVLCLASNPTTHLLDINAFLDPACCTNAVIQFVTLTKHIPGSQKCPEVYPQQTYTQFSNDPTGIRTWWPLMYTMPGTKFTLTVQGRCLSGTLASNGNNPIFTDTWCWTVVANPDTFRLLIDWFHTSELGMLEIPCIAGEDTYKALLACAASLKTAVTNLQNAPLNTAMHDQALIAAQDALVDCEAFVFANMFLAEFVDLTGPFDYVNGAPDTGPFSQPNGPPPNLAQPVPHDENDQPIGSIAGVIGIIDTFENPCACKLIVDLESMGTRLGISTTQFF